MAALVIGLCVLAACGGGDDDAADTGNDQQVGSSSSTRADPAGRRLPAAETRATDSIAIRAASSFSDGDGPFPTFTEESGSGAYVDDVYRLATFPADSTTNAGYGPDDYGPVSDTEAWFDSRGAPGDAGFGVVCRMQDDGTSYYKMGVGNDGTYAIGVVVENESTILTGDGQWVGSDLLDATRRDFIVRGVCDGDRISLYLGGDLVDSVTDDTLTSGSVGAFVETFDEPNASVDISIFEASGEVEPDAISTGQRDTFEHLFHSAPDEVHRCDLHDSARLRLDTTPLVSTTCDRVTYLATDRPRDTRRIFRELIDQVGGRVYDELRARPGFPDCGRDRDVRGTFPARVGGGGIACVDVGDETLIVWYGTDGIVGLVRVPDDARADLADAWGPGWWPLTMTFKPG